MEVLLQQSQEVQVLQLLYSQPGYVVPEGLVKMMAESKQASPSRTDPQPPTQGQVPDAAAEGVAASAPVTAGTLSPQLGLDIMARAALPARYGPVPASAMAASAAGGGDAAAYVSALLARGDVLRAARVLRRYRVSRPSVKEFLEMVGATGDEAALAAVYRTFQVCV